MSEYGYPVLYALFAWWFSTGLILYLDGLPQRTFRWSMAAATLLLVLALFGLVISSGDTSVAGAYIGFSCGLLAWGWHEMSYYMDFIGGPRKQPCPPGCRGWQRFWLALQTSLYHELCIVATAVLMVMLTWGEPNQIGVWTFVILWLMRWSAKLNVFLGVRNLNEDWLPEHLGFLASYFTKKPMNLLFPLSVTAATVTATLLLQQALAADSGTFEISGLILLFTLLVLAILEHWFLILPLPLDALWQWGLKSHQSSNQTKPPPSSTRQPFSAKC